jgi:hypothetical protein
MDVMVAKRDDTGLAGGFRFDPWMPVDEGDMYAGTSFRNARDELATLINNIAYARPEDEREALLAVGTSVRDLDDTTTGHMLTLIRTAMVAAQPRHSKTDHLQRRRERRAFQATLKTLHVNAVMEEEGLDPDQRNATNLVGKAMYRRKKDPNDEYYRVEPLPDHDIRRGLKRLKKETTPTISPKKSKPLPE